MQGGGNTKTTRAWVKHLLKWFAAGKRSMPWRADPTPYRVWISEVMLQQTRVEAVIPYFLRFVARFPDLQTLARADLQDVLKVWEGLGYYSRARNLHVAVRQIVEQHAGRIPASRDELRTLPGIGDYTAAAIASIAFGQPVPVVDGNVLRVFARFWGVKDDIGQPRVRADFARRLEPAIAGADPSAFNQAIMELGALICIPRHPRCGVCPLRRTCVALQAGRTEDLPRKAPKAAVPHYDIAVGVIWKRGKILIAKRRQDQMLGGLWEFPGGKRRPGEPLRRTARREIREETGLVVRIAGRPYALVEHGYAHFTISMTAFRCAWVSGRARAHSADELRWIRPEELDDYPFPRANRKIAEAIQASLPASP